MDVPAKNGDSWKQTRADCIENLKKLFPHIKASDMTTIVNSIFKLLQVTDKVEAQHTKKRLPRKRTEQQKENKRKSNETKKAARLQRGEEARQGKAAGESPTERQTPQKAAQQKQKTPAGYAETEEDGAYGEDAY